jgi:hypothetical protein
MKRGIILINSESREQLLALPNLPKEFKNKLEVMAENSDELFVSTEELEKIIDLLPPPQPNNKLRKILTKQLRSIT